MFETHRGRVFIAIGLIAAIVIGGADYYSYRYWEREITSVVEQEAMVLARTIEAGIMVAMMKGAPKKINELLEFAGQAPDVAYVRVINREGNIVVSTMPSEDGTEIEGEPATLLRGTAASVTLRRKDELGGSVHIFLPIINRERCHACHDPGVLTNGALDMRIGMAETLKPLERNAEYTIVFGAVAVAALFGALFAIFRIGRAP